MDALQEPYSYIYITPSGRGKAPSPPQTLSRKTLRSCTNVENPSRGALGRHGTMGPRSAVGLALHYCGARKMVPR